MSEKERVYVNLFTRLESFSLHFNFELFFRAKYVVFFVTSEIIVRIWIRDI